MLRRAWLISVLFSACFPLSESPDGGSGAGGGSGGGTAREFPQQVKLQGTIELKVRTYDRPGGSVVFEGTSKGSFAGTSSRSDHNLARLHYEFDQPFTVSGTKTSFDTTVKPEECTVDVTGSSGSNLHLYVGSSGGAYVAQLVGSVFTSATGTCANGNTVQTGFALDLPNSDCPDPAVKLLAGQRWLGVAGDPYVGFELSQDITCDRATVKITLSVEGL